MFDWVVNTPLLETAYQCVKSVRIRSYSGPHFPAFELNTERYSVSLRIHSRCAKTRTRITSNRDTFYAMITQDFDYTFLVKVAIRSRREVFKTFPKIYDRAFSAQIVDG